MRDTCFPSRRFAGLMLLMLSSLTGLPGLPSCFSPVWAGGTSWTTFKLPSTPSAVDGFTCDIAILAGENEGYLPLRITARSSVGRFPGDRTIQLRLLPQAEQNWPTPQAIYLASFTLEAGSATCVKSIYLPKYFLGLNGALQLYDAGGSLPGYRATLTNSVPNLARIELSPLDVMPRFALIMPDEQDLVSPTPEPWQHIPDLRSLDSMVFPLGEYLLARNVVRAENDQALNYLTATSLQASQLLRFSDAHDNWLGYESVDVVMVAWPILEKLNSTQPAKYAALRNWVSSGGVIWTYAAPSVAEMADFFAVQPPLPDPEDEPSLILKSLTPGIPLASPQDTQQLLAFLPRAMSAADTTLRTIPRTELPVRLPAGHPILASETAAELEAELRRLPVEAGLVIGIQSADPFPGSAQLWHTARRLSGSNQVWQHRRGTSLVHGTTGYWDWLLANVARPPVYAFLFVLTGFVLLVGPVSYHFTRRAGRTYLMFIIAPVLATLATLMLFGYGFVADGFGTQVRARQITWVDGQSGNAARMTRATYFAAFRQNDGLQFPLDAAVYPVRDTVESWQTRRQEPRSDRQILLSDEHQQFLGEFFPARSQNQFLCFEPAIGPQSIKVLTATARQLTIQNNCSADIDFLLLADQAGDYWQLTDAACPSGGTSQLTPLASEKLGNLLRQLYLKDQPEPPFGYSAQARDRRAVYEIEQILSRQTATDQPWTSSNAELGVFEARLQTMILNDARLPPGWFVATASLERRAIAVPSADAVESVHYIMGSLQW